MKNKNYIWSGLLACGLFAGCATPPAAKISPSPAVVPVPQLSSLNLYWDGSDNYTTCDDAKKDGYGFVRVEGFVFSQPQPGTIPLKQYWSARRHDHWLLIGDIPKNVEKNGAYKFVRIEGYVYPGSQPGAVALKLFSHVRGDNFTTATAQGEKDAINAGYGFRRTEGYVIPSPENADSGGRTIYNARINGGGIVLKNRERFDTPKTFRPPVEITIVAKTDSTNLRIGYAADQVIFNWELDGQQLRVDGGPANGLHKSGAGSIPAGKFVTIRWLVTPSRQAIYVDDKLRFEHSGDYSHIDRNVSIFPAEGSKVTVRSVTVRQLSSSDFSETNNPSPAIEIQTVSAEQIQKQIAQLNLFKVKLKFVKVDSEEPQDENNYGRNAVDGDPNTYWHTQWQSNSPPLPHEIIIELVPPSVIKGFTYLPRQDLSDHGTIKDYEFYVSDDGKNFGQPVKKGAFEPGKEEKIKTFEPIKCRFIKLKALSEINGLPWTSAAEIGVILELKQVSIEQIEKWIVQLNDPDFSQRNAAVASLAQHSSLALPAMEAALKTETDADRRWWIQSAIQECQK
jgi:hypothetical protein